MSRWGLRDLGELCDHLHTAYNSPSRRSPSSTEAPTGAGPFNSRPCCQRVAAELRPSGSGRRCQCHLSRWQTPSRGARAPAEVRARRRPK